MNPRWRYLLVFFFCAVVIGIGQIKFMSPGELNKSFFGLRKVDAGKTKFLKMSLTAKMSDRGDEDGDAAEDSWRPFVVPLLRQCQFGSC